MRTFRYLCLSLIAASLSPFIASAQSIPFQLRIQQGSNVIAVTNNGTLTIAADAIGKAVDLQFTAVYTGSTSATISSVGLVGAADFSVIGGPNQPVTLTPGGSLSLVIRYTATTGNQVSAQFVLSYAESLAGTQSATTGPATQIILNLVGTAPDFAFAYILQSNNNTVPLPAGGNVTFPPTTVNTSATASLVIMNVGTAAGMLSSITVAGDNFQLLGLPLLPGSLAAAKNVSVTLRYSPQTLAASTGTVQIGLPDRTATFGLAGTAIGPSFTYHLLSSDSTNLITAGQPISFADTAVGATSQLAIQVTNTGTADGQINSINLLGTGFALTDLPFLPIALSSGSSLIFTIQFAPTQPGKVNAKLRIGSDSFDVTGVGLGALLTYSYSSGDNTLPILPAGAAIFSPLQVGQSSSSSFTVLNKGTSSVTLSSIDIVLPTQNSSSYFALSNLPQLPVNLAPGSQFSFTVAFSPVATGAATATLRIDTQTFSLSGSGTPPPPLPTYSFQGPTGPQQALAQPSIGLTLNTPYPMTITGALTISIDPGAFRTDPTVQFATGGLIVKFTIPANTTQALFGNNNSTQVRLQTGTIAGTINVTPNFQTPGGFDLTPQSPVMLTMPLLAAVPQLLDIQLSSSTSNTLTFVVTGLATTRSLDLLTFQFTPVPTYNLAATTFPLNVQPYSVLWYNSSASQAYGSLFTAAVSFTAQTSASGASPINGIQSVAVTATNSQGSSNSVSLAIN